MKQVKIKRIALSLAALLLVISLSVGVTYGWIDDLKLVEFQNDSVSENKAPLKAGVDINSDVVINNTNYAINLGNVLEDSDIMYTEGEGENEKKAVRYQDADGTAGKLPNWSEIDKKKGYFYESGGMHLSGCYADGENFFFPTGDGGFREGNKDDENVNYISFTLKVSSPDANVDFWFPYDSQPYVCEHNNTSSKLENARFSISVDGKSHVYSNSGSALTRSSADLTETEAVSGARKIEAYTFYPSNASDTDRNKNKTDDRGYNGNTLFSIKKGATVNLNVKIWLETGFNAEDLSTVDVNFKLMSSWGETRTITITDHTTALSASSWIGNDGAKMYLTLPSVLMDFNNELAKTNTDFSKDSTANWDDIAGAMGELSGSVPFFELVRDGISYTVQVPLAYNNQNMVLYRCSDYGWNKTQKTSENATKPIKRGPEKYQVNCWNWWESYLPDTFQDETYTIYGSSYDDVAVGAFGGEETNKGYGTWGAVEEIKLDGKTNSLGTNGAYGSGDNLATKNGQIFVRDYSDYATSGEIYTYVMRSLSESGSDNGQWTTYVPSSSTAIQFYGKWVVNNATYEGFWGYRSWSGTNPQLRPSGVLTYYATQVVNSKEGVGFWDGHDHVYLIKNGTLVDATQVQTTLYDSNPAGTTATGYQNMTVVDGLEYGDTGHTYSVYVNSTTGNSTPAHYYHCKFSNGSTGNTNESAEKVLFPGCYFDWANDRWLGALTSDDRGGGEDIGGGGSSSGGGGSSGGGSSSVVITPILTSEPTEDGVYLFGNLNGGSSNTEYALFDSSQSGGKVVLSLTSGNTYSIKVKRRSGGSWTPYANGKEENKVLSLGVTQSSWNISSSHSDFINFSPVEQGTFTVTLGNLSNDTQQIGWSYE